MQTVTLKRVLLVGGASALACLISTFSASAQNLLIDPSYELNTAASAGGWNGGGSVRATGEWMPPPATGGHSFRLPAGSNAVNLAFEGPLNPNLTNITAGSEFDLTAYGLVTNAIISGFSGVQATFFSASGANLGTVQTSPGQAIFSNQINSNNATISASSSSPTNGTWIPLDTGVFTAPTGSAYMDVFAISVDVVESNGAAGTWIDNLSLVAVPEPSTMMLGLIGIGLPLLMMRRRSRQA